MFLTPVRFAVVLSGAAVAGAALGGPSVPASQIPEAHSPRDWRDPRRQTRRDPSFDVSAGVQRPALRTPLRPTGLPLAPGGRP